MSTVPIASPCISVCKIHARTGWCTGCLRTLDEIAAWSSMNDAQKQVTWLELGRRRVQWRSLRRDSDDSLPPDNVLP